MGSKKNDMYAPWLGEKAFGAAEEEAILGLAAAPTASAPAEPGAYPMAPIIDLRAMEQAMVASTHTAADPRDLENLSPAEDDALFLQKQSELIMEWAETLADIMKAPPSEQGALSMRLYMYMKRISEQMAYASAEMKARIAER